LTFHARPGLKDIIRKGIWQTFQKPDFLFFNLFKKHSPQKTKLKLYSNLKIYPWNRLSHQKREFKKIILELNQFPAQDKRPFCFFSFIFWYI